MRPTLVKDRENMTMLVEQLRKSGHTPIDTGNGEVDVYKDGKMVKKIKVREASA